MKQKPHILMVLDHPFPHDLRVENEAFALIKEGFLVTVLSISPDKRPLRESYKGIDIIRYHIGAQWQKKLRAVIPQFPLYGYIIQKAIYQAFKSEKFDYLHMHDLYLFGAGLKAKETLHIPVIGDLHENYVDALQHYQFTQRFPMKYIFDLNKWRHLEKKWIIDADKIIVVIEEAFDRIRSLSVDKNNIIIVPNTINIDEFDEYDINESIVQRHKDKFKITYTGGIDLHRGIDTIIKAIPHIKDKIREVLLILVGDGIIKNDLKKLAKRLGVSEHIKFEGWQPQDLIKSYIQNSDICIIPHRQTTHTNATIPHKLFHYMYMKKPVIVSNCKPLERIVTETNAGLVHKSDDPGSMSEKVIQLYSNKSARLRMGINGYNAVMNKYNWNVSSKSLINLYKTLSDKR